MIVRAKLVALAACGCVLLTGCHHAKPVAVAPPPPPPASGPVMVSVPPPTHRSEPLTAEEAAGVKIPVVKPVKPPKQTTKRTPPPAAPVTAPVQVAAAPVTPPGPSLGQLTAGVENPSVSRDQSAQALRAQRDRLSGVSQTVQNAHAPELEQVRRFLASATDSWKAADYAGAVALTTKAKVLLDDVLK